MEKKKTKKQAAALPKVFADLIEKHVKKITEIEIGEGDEKLVIKVNPVSYPSSRASAIINAANLLFNDYDSSVEGYMPAFLEFAFRYGVLRCYTDIELPEALDHSWLVVNHTPIYDKVAEIVGEEEICAFRYELDELIYARKEERIHMINVNRILEKLSGVIESFTAQLKDIDINELAKDIESLPKTLKNLPKEFAGGELGSLINSFLDANGDLKGKK